MPPACRVRCRHMQIRYRNVVTTTSAYNHHGSGVGVHTALGPRRITRPILGNAPRLGRRS